MGLSYAVAGGILFVAASLAGFQVSGEVFDQQDAAAAAWNEFYEMQEYRQDTAFSVDDVKKFGSARTEITLTNTGQSTIDIEGLSVTYGGSPEPIVKWSIDNQPARWWRPGAELVLELAPLAVNDVVVADGYGTKAYGP